jgi:DUF883 C-terminal glycine zipper region
MESAPRKEPFATPRPSTKRVSADNDATIADLRRDLDRVIDDWGLIVRESAERQARAAENIVRSHPWESVAVAMAIGALVAVALVPKRNNVSANADVDRRVKPAQRTALRAPETQPLSSRLSQTWDSITALDAHALPPIPSFESLMTLAKSFLPGKGA